MPKLLLCAALAMSCSSGTDDDRPDPRARDSGVQDADDGEAQTDAHTEDRDGSRGDWPTTLAAFCDRECQGTQGLSCAVQYASQEACSAECRTEWDRLQVVRCDTEVPAYVFCADDHPGAQSYSCPGGVKTAADDSCYAAFAAVKQCAEN